MRPRFGGRYGIAHSFGRGINGGVLVPYVEVSHGISKLEGGVRRGRLSIGSQARRQCECQY